MLPQLGFHVTHNELTVVRGRRHVREAVEDDLRRWSSTGRRRWHRWPARRCRSFPGRRARMRENCGAGFGSEGSGVNNQHHSAGRGQILPVEFSRMHASSRRPSLARSSNFFPSEHEKILALYGQSNQVCLLIQVLVCFKKRVMQENFSPWATK
jgi:hypothetical protein